MPINLEQVRLGLSSVLVKYGDESVLVEYRAGAVTVAWVRAIDWPDENSIAEAVLAVAISWDVSENGQVLPITAANIDKLPRALVARILSAIVYDVSPGKTKSASFAGGSDQTANSVTSPNGTTA